MLRIGSRRPALSSERPVQHDQFIPTGHLTPSGLHPTLLLRLTYGPPMDQKASRTGEVRRARESSHWRLTQAIGILPMRALLLIRTPVLLTPCSRAPMAAQAGAHPTA